MQQDLTALKEQFTRLFGAGGKIHVVRAPGRVNLIGEHTDYNEGFVFPMAIEPEVTIVCRSRGDSIIKATSTVFPKEFVEFSLERKITTAKPAWGNYVRGAAAELIAAGIPLVGMDALISNTLAVGGGLSSSAALEVATSRALLLLGGITMDVQRLALICQKAEHEFAHVPCGIMDQMVVAGAKAGHAMLLDCRSMTRQFTPIDSKELRIVIANSMVKHELNTGEYAMRRRQCEEGVAALARKNAAVKSLRDARMPALEGVRDGMSEVVFRRCRHVITENERTVEMAKCLADCNYERAGELMVQSHNSLRDDYEVSCAELDFLVDEAMKNKGVYGARMTGGGFGGSIVTIVQPRSVEALLKQLHESYTQQFGRQPNILVTTATEGVSVVE